MTPNGRISPNLPLRCSSLGTTASIRTTPKERISRSLPLRCTVPLHYRELPYDTEGTNLTKPPVATQRSLVQQGASVRHRTGESDLTSRCDAAFPCTTGSFRMTPNGRISPNLPLRCSSLGTTASIRTTPKERISRSLPLRCTVPLHYRELPYDTERANLTKPPVALQFPWYYSEYPYDTEGTNLTKPPVAMHSSLALQGASV